MRLTRASPGDGEERRPPEKLGSRQEDGLLNKRIDPEKGDINVQILWLGSSQKAPLASPGGTLRRYPFSFNHLDSLDL
ncbi:hypothetical protein F2Q69_00056373 [Brassica cretica]|uniref:Uncharacterized protein n=1 Tax=Brassica cretica TaxID=69181 RepID=A0A8S9MXN2_BRACR|nr:hypothetical protein F2Q69_00056373 [Brassica cretica]